MCDQGLHYPTLFLLGMGATAKAPDLNPSKPHMFHETASLSKVHVTQSPSRYADMRLACQTLTANGLCAAICGAIALLLLGAHLDHCGLVGTRPAAGSCDGGPACTLGSARHTLLSSAQMQGIHS